MEQSGYVQPRAGDEVDCIELLLGILMVTRDRVTGREGLESLAGSVLSEETRFRLRDT